MRLFIYLILSLSSVTAFAQTNKVTKTLDDSLLAIKDESNASAYALQMSDDSPDRWLEMGAIDDAHPAYSYIAQTLGGDLFAKHPKGSVHIGIIQIPNKLKKYMAYLYVDRYTEPHKKTSEATLSIGIFTMLFSNILGLDKRIEPLIKLSFSEYEEFQNFDWAPYKLGTLGRALGIRTYRWSCGAGGSMCSNELLRLVTLEAPAIREIFIAPVGFYGNYGGEWNVMDGTRQHIVQELKGIVSVGSVAKSNPPNIVVKTRLHSKLLKRTFVWTKRPDGSMHYETKDREIFPKVDKYESLDDPYWSMKSKK